MKSYYEVLGIDRNASEKDIRDRFRQLAREHHPDRFHGGTKAEAERKFQELTEAMNVLTNSVRRKQHDAALASGTAPTDPKELARVYMANGVKNFKGGNFAAASENFEMAANHAPSDAKAWHYLALAASKTPGKLRVAVQAIENALQRDGLNPQLHRDAARIYVAAERPLKAVRHIEEALKWDADDAEMQNLLRNIRGSEGKEQGKPLFKKG